MKLALKGGAWKAWPLGSPGLSACISKYSGQVGVDL